MIIKPATLEKQFKSLRSGGLSKKGLSTGFDCLDDNVRLTKGYMAIITGYPGSGKSEWLDAILVNMTLQHQWRITYYSPENHPIEQHMSKLAEKYIGKHITEMTTADLDDAMGYLTKYYTWMYPENPMLDTLLELSKEEAKSSGIDCLVIDPWNSVTHHRHGEMIHEYLSEALTKVIRFTRDMNVFTAIVAHPKVPIPDKEGNLPVPNMYSISDGAMWRNKADYGIVVHRPDMSKNAVEIYLNKLKYKHFGKLGMVEMDYNYRNGRFKGLDDQEFLLPTDTPSPF
jgi:twinkle protein